MRTIDDVISEIEKSEVSINEINTSIDNTQSQIDSFEVSDYYDESDHISTLNTFHGTIDVCGHDKDAGQVLYEVDYTAFREDYNNYTDSIDLDTFSEYNTLTDELEELKEELEEEEETLHTLEEELEELKEELEEEEE